MHRLRLLGPMVLLLALTACGSGGGDTTVIGPTSTTPPEQIAQQILENCAAGSLNELIAVANLIQDVINGDGPGAGFVIGPGITLVPGVILPWTVDLEPDGTLDGNGAFRFRDASGAPTQPFAAADATALQGGDLSVLGTALQNVPDGTQMVTRYDLPGPPSLGGNLTVAFQGGQAGDTSGKINVVGGGCSVEHSWAAIALGNLTTQFPTGTFDTEFTSASDTLIGTIVTNGTRTATATMTLNGTSTNTFTVDLVTGQVSQI